MPTYNGLMSAEPKQAFRAVVDAYEAWRDKRGLTRKNDQRR
jgi:hypothetical protein